MINANKARRTKLGRILLSINPNRHRIKKLIGYPELISIKINADISNLDLSVKLRDDAQLTDVSNLTNVEILNHGKIFDTSKNSALIEINAKQSGAWSANDVGYLLNYSDGSIVSRSIVNENGDGSGDAIAFSISESVEAPPGWGDL